MTKAAAALPSGRVVVRLTEPAAPNAAAAIEVLLEEGLDFLTVPITAAKAGASLAARFGGRLGFGCHDVGSAADVKAAVKVGAGLVIARRLAPEIASAASTAGVASLLPALTPVEIANAADCSPTAVLVHPADMFGIHYCRTLLQGDPDLRLVGSNLGAYAARHWLEAGALAVVPDVSLIGDALEGGNLGQLRERARSYATEVAN